MLYAMQRRTFVTRLIHQQETKAAAFVVCESLGVEARPHFADCQLYYGDARLLTESLEVVHRTAAQILGAISPEDGAPFKSAQGCGNERRSRHFRSTTNSPYARRLAIATYAGFRRRFLRRQIPEQPTTCPCAGQ